MNKNLNKIKNIIVCTDGTLNRPKKNLNKDFPTNVLKLARAMETHDSKGEEQIVFKLMC